MTRQAAAVLAPKPCAWLDCGRPARFVVELEDTPELLCPVHAAEFALHYKVSQIPAA